MSMTPPPPEKVIPIRVASQKKKSKGAKTPVAKKRE